MPRLQTKLPNKENIAISNYNKLKLLSLLIFLRAAILDFMMSLHCPIVSNKETSAVPYEQPSAFPSSMRDFVTPRVIHLMSISFINLFFARSVCTKECKFLTKTADKRTIHTFVKALYISFLPSLMQVCWARSTLQNLLRTTIWKNTTGSRFVRAPSSEWTSSKLKTEV